MTDRQEDAGASRQRRYRVELLCDDCEWLIVAGDLTRAEADRELSTMAGDGRRYRIVSDGRSSPTH